MRVQIFMALSFLSVTSQGIETPASKLPVASFQVNAENWSPLLDSRLIRRPFARKVLVPPSYLFMKRHMPYLSFPVLRNLHPLSCRPPDTSPSTVGEVSIVA